DLYGRLSVFVAHLNKVGRQLSSSVESYNRAVGSLERKVLPGARKFIELGIHPRKELEEVEPLESLPRTMIEDSQLDEDESLFGMELDEDTSLDEEESPARPEIDEETSS
ncbi:MAG: DNA recombination protein RmuC, partial [Woeseiaceae bacterium]